jgi:hypothetical protein
LSATYIDCLQYRKQPTGLSVAIANYIGNSGHISAAVAGATSLTVPATTVAQVQYDSVWIFDGPNSEVVQIGAAGALSGATSLPLQAGTQYAHAAGTPYCTDGTAGSLGQQIFIASQWIEDDICFQSLWATTYTGEILTMPTMRAALDNQQNLHFRPRHFPVTALSAVSIQTNTQYSLSYDPTQAIIDSDQQTVDLPVMSLLSTSGSSAQANPWYPALPFGRSSNAWLTLTYTAGYAQGALPWPIVRACTLLVSECFLQLENPMGADSIQQGKRNVTFMLRGDTSGESLLVKQAVKLLSKYVMQSF